MSRRTQSDIRKSIDASLSFLNSYGQTALRVLSHAQSMQHHSRKSSLVPLFALLFLLLLAAVACATFTFGVLDLRP